MLLGRMCFEFPRASRTRVCVLPQHECTHHVVSHHVCLRVSHRICHCVVCTCEDVALCALCMCCVCVVLVCERCVVGTCAYVVLCVCVVCVL